jgi:CheY-like chemotaxis protein
MYAEYLAHTGFVPVPVATAAEALRLASSADVIVTGILLPGRMDGVEFISQLRSDERTRTMPVIVLTTCAWQHERERAVGAGCDVFLSKPCLPDALVAEVRRLLAVSKVHGVRGRAAHAAPRAERRRSA